MKPPIKGILLAVSAASGTGKTTLLRSLLQEMDNLHLSVSCTTRPKRTGERDGVDYHFVSTEEFIKRRERGHFLEWAEVFGNLYGTPAQSLHRQLEDGLDVVLEIDFQGAAMIRKLYPSSVTLFLLPPSKELLAERLRRRSRDTSAAIARRLAKAAREISHFAEFDYLVVNNDFAEALRDLMAIIRAERVRTARQQQACSALLADFLLDE